MFPFSPFMSSPWRNYPKIEGHNSIEMLNLFEMPFSRVARETFLKTPEVLSYAYQL